MREFDVEKATIRQGGMTISQIGINLGAELSGIKLANELAPASVTAIEALLAEHELLIFRDQDLSSVDLLRFGRQFGELTVHPFAPAQGETPELIKFRNDATSAPFGTDCWHSDETFRAEPPMATALFAQVVPIVGGDTVFTSMSAAFDGLSDRMQQHISGLEAIHDIVPFKRLFGTSPDDQAQLQHYERLYPPQVHPVVRVHPVSGRKVLFVNPNFTVCIKGMDARESRALLDTLYQQAYIPEFQYRLQWRAQTLAFWDNRSTQHYAVHDYFPQRRYMERVTIRGGPVVGVTVSAQPAVSLNKTNIPEGVDPYGGHKPHAHVDL